MNSYSVPRALRHEAQAYLPLLQRKGLPLTQRNKKAVSDVLSWLREREAHGHFASVPRDPAQKAKFLKELGQQYKDEAYGSIWMMVLYLAIKVIITLVIEAYFS